MRKGRKQSDVFISYAKEDKETVEQIAWWLEENGLKVWFDGKLKAGDNFVTDIFDAIGYASFWVLILSKSYITKSFTNVELGAILAQRRPDGIIPVYHHINEKALSGGSFDTIKDRQAVSTESGPEDVANAIAAKVGKLIEWPRSARLPNLQVIALEGTWNGKVIPVQAVGGLPGAAGRFGPHEQHDFQFEGGKADPFEAPFVVRFRKRFVKPSAACRRAVQRLWPWLRPRG